MEKLFELKELEYPKEITIELKGDSSYTKDIKKIFFDKDKGTHSITKAINDNIESYLEFSGDNLKLEHVYKLNVIIDKEANQQITFVKAEKTNQFKEGIFYLVVDFFGTMPVYCDLNDENAIFNLDGLFKKDGNDPFKTIAEVFPTTIEMV